MTEQQPGPASLDEVVRRALHAAAEPGDPTGVAEAIRARLDGPGPGGPDGGGATGGPVAGGGPTGGGPLGGLLPWVAGAAVVAVLAGGALGLSGALGRPSASAPAGGVALDLTAGPGGPGTVSAHACPGAAVVGELTAGDRVLALGTHDGWVAIRDPRATDRVVWVEENVLQADEGEADLASLPVTGCPELVAALATPPTDGPDAEVTQEPTTSPTDAPTQAPRPEPAPGPDPGPAPGPDPAPEPEPEPDPGDTVAPQILQLGVTAETPPVIYTAGCGGTAWDNGTLDVVASDEVGVTGVRVGWPGRAAFELTSLGGHEWRATVGTFASAGSVTLTITARDAAGNTSQATTTVTVEDCLF